MTKKQKLGVTVTVFNDEENRYETFRSGETPPDWAREKITNPDVWEGEPALRTPVPRHGQGTWVPQIVEDDEEVPQVDDYDEMSVDELRDELRERDLPTSGRKHDLIERLRTFDDEEREPAAFEEDEEEEEDDEE